MDAHAYAKKAAYRLKRMHHPRRRQTQRGRGMIQRPTKRVQQKRQSLSDSAAPPCPNSSGEAHHAMNLESRTVLLSIWVLVRMEMIARRECTFVARRGAGRSTPMFQLTRARD